MIVNQITEIKPCPVILNPWRKPPTKQVAYILECFPGYIDYTTFKDGKPFIKGYEGEQEITSGDATMD